nr:D-lyxose/D-mannose family sugar isomerase [Nitratireductor aquimarinus]
MPGLRYDHTSSRFRTREVAVKRSRVNEILRQGEEFIRSFGYVLPPFADWTPEEMKHRRAAIDGIVDARLGWDITDYGAGDFDRRGLFLFTVRNGNQEDLKHGRGMLYAEKIMISRRDQLAPLHTHAIKAEDIINRGGGTLCIELFGSDPEGGIDRVSPVRVPTDGVMRRVDAGGVLRLEPGESVTLLPGVWHAFWGEREDVLIGEVSTVNDDVTDNIFAEPIARFSEIEEDEEPCRLLVSDYATRL